MELKFIFKKILPEPVWKFLQSSKKKYLRIKYNTIGRSNQPGETSKAKERRLKENFFNNYCTGKGLDIGYGGDLICDNAIGFDFEHGDAQYLSNVLDNQFDFVYSSHTIEHLNDPAIGIRNWYRVLKTGGYLIIYLPHRDLYEKKKTLPSRFNPNHKNYFLIDKDDPPDTIGILSLIQSTLKNYEIIYVKKCSSGHTITEPDIHSDGEYSIEVVLRKFA